MFLDDLSLMEIRQALDSIELHEIFRAHHVERAELFGSAGRRNHEVLMQMKQKLRDILVSTADSQPRIQLN